jgi:hypothetical protein
MYPKRARGNERRFDAVRAPLNQHLLNGQYCFAAYLVVDRNPVEEALDLLRRPKARQNGEFAFRQAKIFAPCKPSMRHFGHR